MAIQGRRQAVGIWVLSALLGALYLTASGPKLAGTQATIDHFAKWGYPDWLRVVIGVVELTGAFLLLIPRLAIYGAGALGMVMIGAAFTHLTHAEASSSVLPLVLLVLLGVVGYARRASR